MSWRRLVGLALLSLTVSPTFEPPREEPLSPGERRPDGVVAETWTRRSVTVTASSVRLNKLGARTHGNWAMFRLPFDANRLGRLRAVRFTPSNAAPTDVGSIRIGSVCLPSPSTGSIESWTLYTTSGVGYTRRYERHPAPPTSDPTIASINVPTRVANYVACGWDAGRLRDPDHWKLRIDWEER